MATAAIPPRDVYLVPLPSPPPVSLPNQPTHNIDFGGFITLPVHHKGFPNTHIYMKSEGTIGTHPAPFNESVMRVDVPGRETVILRTTHAASEGPGSGTTPWRILLASGLA